MAAGSFYVYSNGMLNIAKAAVNLNADTFVLTLLTGSYTPNVSTDATWTTISANELTTAGGYTAGGFNMTDRFATLTGDTVKFSCTTAPNWAAFSATCRYGVIVRRAGGSLTGTDLLIAYSDLGGGSNVVGGGGTLTVTPNASGLFTLTHTP